MKGWVYIITNKAMLGLVKVGYSHRDPENRAKELNSTASPHPHSVEFAVLVDKPKQVEQLVHQKLNKYHEGKEWFRCSVDSAKAAIINDQANPTVTHGTKKSVSAISSEKESSAQPPVIETIHHTPKCHKCRVVIELESAVLSVDSHQVCKNCFESTNGNSGFFARLFQ